MTNGPSTPNARSRRSILAAGAALSTVAAAGCLDSLVGTTSATEYEPEEVSDPPNGTPGEFYYAIEERIEGYDLTVERLFENDGDLILEYRSDAAAGVEEGSGDDAGNETDGAGNETDDPIDVDDESAESGDDSDEEDVNETDGGDESNESTGGEGSPSDELEVEGPFGSPVEEYTLEEAGAITQAFNLILMEHGGGSDYGMLVGDVVNPIEGQPHGWGVKTEWLEEYNAGERGAMGLANAISQMFVYEEDFEDDS